jgi:enoyl-CoA hydratase/carnithine racemase
MSLPFRKPSNSTGSEPGTSTLRRSDLSRRVTVDLDDHLLLIGIDRPDKRNAFDLAALEQPSAAYQRLGEDAKARVGVLYAHGPHFSAGLDLAKVGPVRAPAQLGWGNAMRFLLTAAEFGATKALRIGLVQQVVPAGQQLDRAVTIARAAIAAQAPLGSREPWPTPGCGAPRPSGPPPRTCGNCCRRCLQARTPPGGLRSFTERRAGRFTGR